MKKLFLITITLLAMSFFVSETPVQATSTMKQYSCITVCNADVKKGKFCAYSVYSAKEKATRALCTCGDEPRCSGNMNCTETQDNPCYD